MVAYNYKDPQKRTKPFTRKNHRKSLLTFRGITKKIKKIRKNTIPKQIVINTSQAKPVASKPRRKIVKMNNGPTKRMTEAERLARNSAKYIGTLNRRRTRGQQKKNNERKAQRELEELQAAVAADPALAALEAQAQEANAQEERRRQTLAAQQVQPNELNSLTRNFGRLTVGPVVRGTNPHAPYLTPAQRYLERIEQHED